MGVGGGRGAGVDRLTSSKKSIEIESSITNNDRVQFL